MGLAIAHKLVTAHGGKIWCTSSEENQTVEFKLTLPIDPSHKDLFDKKLPISAKEFYSRSDLTLAKYKASNSQIVDDPRIFDFENKINQYKRRHSNKLIISILDDEIEYLNSLTKLIKKNPLIKDLLSINLFRKVDLQIQIIESSHLKNMKSSTCGNLLKSRFGWPLPNPCTS